MKALWLAGVAVLLSMAAAAQDAPPTLNSVMLERAAAPLAAAGRSAIDDLIGRPIDDALLTQLRVRLQAAFTAQGRPFVRLAIPGQDVADGVVRVEVTEATLGEVRLNGNRWFDDNQYFDAITLQQGDPLDIVRLKADLDWLNRNEHRTARIAISPGDKPDVYDLTLSAADQFPLDVALVAGNTGTTGTGLYRAGIVFDWTNAFWRGDDLNYGFLTDPVGLRLLQHSVSYTMFLYDRHALTFSAATAQTRGSLVTDADANGTANVLSLRYSWFVPAWTDSGQRIDAGWEYKSTNTNLLSGGTSVFASTSELDQLVFSYTIQHNETARPRGLSVTLVASPGNLTPHNTNSALSGQQPGAAAAYVYARLAVELSASLPGSLTWTGRGTGQFSSGNLLSSEQLVFGGLQSVRGFVEQAATRDAGMVLQQELRLAPETFGGLNGLTPFAFLDAGLGRNHSGVAGEQRSWVALASIGPGLEWQATPNIALRLAWGMPLVRAGHAGHYLGPEFGTVITF